MYLFFIAYFIIVNALEVEIKEDNTNGLNINETASIELPQNIINIVEDDNIDLAFTLYNKSVLFPVREPPPNTIVGSSVIGARINGVTDGTKLPDPVVINLALKRIAVSNIHIIDIFTFFIFKRILLILAVCTGILMQQV